MPGGLRRAGTEIVEHLHAVLRFGWKAPAWELRKLSKLSVLANRCQEGKNKHVIWSMQSTTFMESADKAWRLSVLSPSFRHRLRVLGVIFSEHYVDSSVRSVMAMVIFTTSATAKRCLCRKPCKCSLPVRTTRPQFPIRFSISLISEELGSKPQRLADKKSSLRVG